MTNRRELRAAATTILREHVTLADPPAEGRAFVAGYLTAIRDAHGITAAECETARDFVWTRRRCGNAWWRGPAQELLPQEQVRGDR